MQKVLGTFDKFLVFFCVSDAKDADFVLQISLHLQQLRKSF